MSVDQIMLYRDDTLINDSSINISQISLNGTVLNDYSLFRNDSDTYDFMVEVPPFDISFATIENNGLNIVPNPNYTEFSIPASGSYRIEFSISTQLNPSSWLYFYLMVNNSPVVKSYYTEVSLYKAICINASEGDVVRLRVVQLNGVSLLNIDSYLMITRIR